MTIVYDPKLFYTPRMPRQLRKAVALVLSIWLVIAGGGSAFSDTLEHDLESVQVIGDGPSKGDAGCSHGCNAHLFAHATAVVDDGQPVVQAAPSLRAMPHEGARVAVSPPESLFLPPKISLA